TPKLGTSFGTPDSIAATRAGLSPKPAGSTWPRITSFTTSGWILARAIASRTAMAPSVVAGTPAIAPPKVPIAVRVALTMTDFGIGESPTAGRGSLAPRHDRRYGFDVARGQRGVGSAGSAGT